MNSYKWQGMRLEGSGRANDICLIATRIERQSKAWRVETQRIKNEVGRKEELIESHLLEFSFIGFHLIAVLKWKLNEQSYLAYQRSNGLMVKSCLDRPLQQWIRQELGEKLTRIPYKIIIYEWSVIYFNFIFRLSIKKNSPTIGSLIYQRLNGSKI